MKYSVLLAALLAVSMTACSKKEESSTTITPAPDAAMPAPDTVVVPAPDVNITTPAPDVNVTVPAPDVNVTVPAPAPAPAP